MTSSRARPSYILYKMYCNLIPSSVRPVPMRKTDNNIKAIRSPNVCNVKHRIVIKSRYR